MSTMDKKVTHVPRCDSCDHLILDHQPDPDGFLACPECGHAHAITRRAKLTVAREALAAAHPDHEGTAALLNLPMGDED